jgi:hypothetical protein
MLCENGLLTFGLHQMNMVFCNFTDVPDGGFTGLQ